VKNLNLSKPLLLKNLTLPNRVFYAPLAGCSDQPFRQMSAKYGQPGLMFCEMVKMEPLVRRDAHTLRLLDHTPDMHPLGAQICGSKVELAGTAARIIEDLGFPLVDLNCGCPVDKVTKDGSGSGLLRAPEHLGEIVKAMVAAVSIPVTVKVRLGWDDNTINVIDVARIVRDAGASAMTIHGRTRQQGYSGSARWEYIRAVKEAVPELILIGNGDVFTAPVAEDLVAATGCDAILVARGTMGQPWIARDILKRQQGIVTPPRSIAEIRQALYEHFEYTLAYRDPHYVPLDMRRVGCWYFKKAPGTRAFREQMSRATCPDQIRKLILEYPFEEAPFTNTDASEAEQE
jgi:tRNA-dihydrouridine synthase B